MDARLRFTLAVSLLHAFTVAVVWAVFSWLFRRGIGRRFQIGSGKPPSPELSRWAVRELALSHALFPVLVYFAVYPLWTARGGRVDAAFPPFSGLVLQLLAFIAIEDTLFYWAHRLLHTRFLFRHVHAKHHRFRYVRVPAAEFAHPIENSVNLIALFAGPIVFGSALPTVLVWIVLRMIETTEAHSGYALTGVSSRHAFHHLHAQRGCYGSFLSPWDWLLGTDRKWREWRKAGSPVPADGQQA
jgi:sterol desaturase/sphingolipid hydroxylase (fatty acid hydroxylase superfamily)